MLTSEIGEVSFNKPEPINNLITWVYENRSFVPIGKLTENENFSIVSDYIGRPVLAFDEKGKKVWSAEYDIYGKLTNLQGDKAFIPFRQLGQYEDIETGLYYNRFRYYSPETGSYISQDPIGLFGNNPNIYAYVFDSNTEVDVFGLEIIPNKVAGNAREAIAKTWLKNKFPNAEILKERYIRDIKGKSVRDAFGSRRRLDFIVIEDGKVKGIFEVTSPTADKRTQLEKEMNIRGKAEGGAHIKAPGRKGALYDISNIETQRLDVDLETKKVKYH
ncbi:RHS repeat domain-containing protein [Capnocytophaga canimorsus]|uniref:RHS repeat domain-containing protein n=1 Tax=Capnocytophaga canimorsus TaxID=28188 RepID=UPI00385F541A